VVVYQQLKSAEKVEIAAGKKPSLPHQKMRTGVMIGMLMIMMTVMARTWFQISLVTYLPEWIQSQGFTLVYGGQLLAVMMVSVGVGSLTGGTLSDYIGRWQVILISMILLAPIYWLFMLTSGPVQMALTAIMGVLIGASFPVALVMAQDAWPDRVGVATSLVIGVGWVTGGIGASVTGYLADKYSLTLGLQFLILAPLVGVLCVIVYALMQRSSTRQKTPQSENVPA
jgi:MFS transporter, FSR family, fosmidomycin resistance protein